MRSLILPEKCTNLPKRLIKQREIRFPLQDSKRPKGLRLFDFFPNYLIPFTTSIFFRRQVKRDARIGQAEAKKDSGIREAIAEEQRMASRYFNDTKIALARR